MLSLREPTVVDQWRGDYKMLNSDAPGASILCQLMLSTGAHWVLASVAC